MKHKLLILVGALGALLTGPLQGDDWQLKQVGRWVVSGDITKVAARGRYAWCASGPAGLQVFDLQQRGKVVPVGRWWTPGGVTAVALTEHHLLAADGRRQLWVLDISRPKAPKPLGHCASPAANNDEDKTNPITDLSVQGNLVYAAAGELYFFDIDRPEAPRSLGRFQLHDLHAERLHQDGRLLAVSGYEAIQITDISTPCSPALLARIKCGCLYNDVFLADGFLYVAADKEGLRIYDLTDPREAVKLSSFQSRDNPTICSVAVRNGIAWLGTDSRGLLVIDVQKPENPQQVGWQMVGGLLQHVVFAGETICLAGGSNGFKWIDTAHPAKPQLLGEYEASGHASGLLASSDTLLVLNGELGLDLFSLADPRRLRPLARVEPGGRILDAALYGRYVLLAAGSAGLLVVDLADPAKPHMTARLPLQGEVTHIWRIDDSTALAVLDSSKENYGLRIVDLTDPAAPRIIGELELPEISALCVDSGCAYVAHGGSPLTVVDLSHRENPLGVAKVDLKNEIYVHQMVVKNRYLYLCEGGFIRTMSLADPLRPIKVADLRLKTESGPANGPLLLSGDTGFVADNLKLWQVDFTRPEQPRKSVCMDLNQNDGSDHYGLVRYGDFLYLSSWGKIMIYELVRRLEH